MNSSMLNAFKIDIVSESALLSPSGSSGSSVDGFAGSDILSTCGNSESSVDAVADIDIISTSRGSRRSVDGFAGLRIGFSHVTQNTIIDVKNKTRELGSTISLAHWDTSLF